jgi:hypothetical protein
MPLSSDPPPLENAKRIFIIPRMSGIFTLVIRLA